jgi:hypothetical protein
LVFQGEVNYKMGNCLSSNKGGTRPVIDLSGRSNGPLDTSGNVGGGVGNSVGILNGISETNAGHDGHNHPPNPHMQNVHHRNPNSLPPVPDTDNNSQVSFVRTT